MVVFDLELAEKCAFMRKRGGQLLEKGRFVSAQLEGYLQDDAWLRYAAQANRAARTLAEGLAALGGEVLHPVEANLLFISLPSHIEAALQDAGHRFGGRLACNWRTSEEDVQAFLATAEKAAGARPAL